MSPIQVATDIQSDSQHSDSCSPPTSGSRVTTPEEQPPDDGSKEKLVEVPDMFSSIMAVKPVVNPLYHEVKPKADAWIAKYVTIGWAIYVRTVLNTSAELSTQMKNGLRETPGSILHFWLPSGHPTALLRRCA
jgi:hypothetical protein